VVDDAGGLTLGSYPRGAGAHPAVQRRGMLLTHTYRLPVATIEAMTEASSPPDGPAVVMYSRRTCGLCDEARAVVLAERAHTTFGFDEVFIDGDEGLEREYGLRVPVVAVDGVEEFEYHVEPSRLRRLVTR
jgi:Glutaredoxin-like domain (DUF836)